MRPAPTIVAAVAVMVSGAVAVSVLGLQSSMPLSFLGAAVGLTFAVWRRPTRGESTLIRRLGHAMLAVSLSVTAVGLVLAGAAGATSFPVWCLPAPPELRPLIILIAAG